MRSTVLVAMMGVLLAAPAWAQVAVPELAPAAPRLYGSYSGLFGRTDIVPLNPGALQWGAPSRIGGGPLHGDVTIDPAAPGVPSETSSSAEGRFAGVRSVGERLSLAASLLDFDVSIAGNENNQSTRQWALSFQGLPDLGVGLAQASRKRRTFDGTVHATDSYDSSVVGASWRTGEHFFLGGAYGREVAHRRENGVSLGKADRGLMMAGAGLRGGGGLLWHLEALTVRAQDFRDPQGFSVDQGYALNQATVEVGFWNLLFGYTAFNADVEEPGGTASVKGFTADAGIAPAIGLTITGRYEANEYEAPDGSVTIQDKVASGAVTWQWQW